MHKNSKNKLFQIHETAHACGLSRSTLMRMEEKGLLTPAYVDPDSGRRYYDNFSVARILQVEKFKAMGLTNEEIIAYFQSGGQAEPLLAALEGRLQDLLRSVEELRIRTAGTRDMSVSVQEIGLPEVICCMQKCMGRTPEEKYNAMFAFYAECIKQGHCLSDEPLFTTLEREDFLHGYIGTEPYPYYVCVPVRKETAETVRLPASKRAFGAVLRRLRPYGRGVADARARGKGTRAEARGAAPCARACRALHRARDRGAALLLPPGAAGDPRHAVNEEGNSGFPWGRLRRAIP